MSRDLDRQLRRHGTRFRLFPQSPALPAFQAPEPVYLAAPPGSIGPGPFDARMYVVDPVRKAAIYGYPYLPPFTGPVHPPAQANRFGHFDTLAEDTRAFCAAHMFGVVHRVLDIWEDYLGHEIRWHFADLLPRLELIPLLEWDNAQSGFGFIETGHAPATASVPMPYCLSFDVLAHELGHAILFAELGVPVGAARTAQFLAFHEAVADLVALISVLHFDVVVDDLLRQTRGNLYVPSAFSRLGELTQTEQIRWAANTAHMDDLRGVTLGLDGNWIDPAGLGREAHDLSQVLTGAVFDVIVDVFQRMLIEQGLLSPRLQYLADSLIEEVVELDDVRDLFADAYRGRHAEFKRVLDDARDWAGYALAAAVPTLQPATLILADIGRSLIEVDRVLSGGRFGDVVRTNFARRGIGVEPDQSPAQRPPRTLRAGRARLRRRLCGGISDCAATDRVLQRRHAQNWR
jgi:hypothetical protein